MVGSSDFLGMMPEGTYLLGDPGQSMRMGLFQEALEAKGGARHAIVMVEGLPVLLVRTVRGQALYPNRGLLNRSAYESDTGYLGLVPQDLLIDSRDISRLGSRTIIKGRGLVTVEDGLFHVRDDVHANLILIDTVGDGRRTAPTRIAHPLPLAA